MVRLQNTRHTMSLPVMRLITVNNHKIKNFTHYYVLNMTNYDVELGIRRA